MKFPAVRRLQTNTCVSAIIPIPALIGRENHPVSVKVPNVGEKVMYQGDYVEMRIPDNEPGFVIKMGLVLSNAQYRYNRTHGLK